MKRRDFLKNTALTSAAIGIPSIVPSSVFGKNAPSLLARADKFLRLIYLKCWQ